MNKIKNILCTALGMVAFLALSAQEDRATLDAPPRLSTPPTIREFVDPTIPSVGATLHTSLPKTQVPANDPTTTSTPAVSQNAVQHSVHVDAEDVATQDAVNESKQPKPVQTPVQEPVYDRPDMPGEHKKPDQQSTEPNAAKHTIDDELTIQTPPLEEVRPIVNSSAPFIQTINSPVLTTEQQHYYDAYKKSLIEPAKISFVQINPYHLQQNEFNLTTTEKTIRIQNTQRIERSGGRYSWFGNSPNLPGWMTCVVNGDMITGSIRLEGLYYRIVPLTGGLHLLVDFDNIEAHGCDPTLRMGTKNNDPSLSLDPVNNTDKNQQLLGSCRIRLLFAYTTAVDNAAADIQSTIQNQVDDYNLANDNSVVTSDVEIARTVEVAYTESNTTTDDATYGRTSDDLLRLFRTSDGIMDNVPTLRSLYDADMVVLLVTALQGSAGAIGGRALVISAGYTEAYCAAVWNNGIPQTTAHEFGHLVGMSHNTEQAGSDPPAYAHGYYYIGSGTHFRTIMAYSTPCTDAGTSCAVIDNWSNPNISYSGNATGTAAVSDNARRANERDDDIAALEAKIGYKTCYSADNVYAREEANMEGGNTLSSAYNAVIYNASSKGLWVAQDSVILKPGFNAKVNSTFIAKTDYCTDIPALNGDGPIYATAKETQAADLHEHTFENSILVFPNPVKDKTTIQFSTAQQAPVRIQLFDINGRMLNEVFNTANLPAGKYQVDLQVTDIPAGIYQCRLSCAEKTTTCKISVVK